MNNKYVKYTSNLKQAQKHVFDETSKEIGRCIVKCILVCVALISMVVIGLMVF